MKKQIFISQALAFLLCGGMADALTISSSQTLTGTDLPLTTKEVEGKSSEIALDLALASGTITLGGNLTFNSFSSSGTDIDYYGILINPTGGGGGEITFSSNTPRYIELYLKEYSYLLRNLSSSKVIFDQVALVSGAPSYDPPTGIPNTNYGILNRRTQKIDLGRGGLEIKAYGKDFIALDGSFQFDGTGPLSITAHPDTQNITAINGSISKINKNSKALELQIKAPNAQVIALKTDGGEISNEIKITQFEAKEGSYIFKGVGETLISNQESENSISVGALEEKLNYNYGIYSNLKGARYGFSSKGMPTQFRERGTTPKELVNLPYATIALLDDATISGRLQVYSKGNVIVPESTHSILYGIYTTKNPKPSQTPLTLTIEGQTGLLLYTKHYDNQAGIYQTASKTYGIYVDGQNTQLEIQKDAQLRMEFDRGGRGFEGIAQYTGFHIKDATLTINNQGKIIFDSYQGSNGTSPLGRIGEKAIALSLENGIFMGKLDFYVDEKRESIIYSRSTFGIESQGTSKIYGKVIFGEGIFNNIPTATSRKQGYTIIKNNGDLTLGSEALILSETNPEDTFSKSFLIDNQGLITFEKGAKAVFGAQYGSLPTEDGIYIKDSLLESLVIKTKDMEFKGENAITLNRANLDISLSGNLDFNGINQSGQEIIATKRIGGNEKLTIDTQNGSQITFTQSQGGKIDKVLADGNLTINLAGKPTRENQSSMTTRHLIIDDIRYLSNQTSQAPSFIVRLDADVSNIQSGFENFNGKAFIDDGSQANSGANDMITLGKNASRNGILKVQLLSGQSLSQKYFLIAKVQNPIFSFNGLNKDGDQADIVSVNGFRVTTLTLHRKDINGSSYYYVTSKGDGTTETPTPPNQNPDGGETPTPPNPDDNNPPSNKPDDETPTPPIQNPDSGLINPSFPSLVQSAFRVNFSLINATLNSLNKRLGEIRALENAQGVWARVFHGKEISKVGLTTENLYTSIQTGYDYAIPYDKNVNFLGFSIAYVNGYSKSSKASYMIDVIELNTGSNTIQTNAVEIALYDSFLTDYGVYSDSIAKFGYYTSDVSMPESKAFKLDNFAISLSEEVGYQAKLGSNKEWLITPQVELSYAYLNGTENTQELIRVQNDNKLKIKSDATHLLRMRAGVDWGYSFNHWNDLVTKANLYFGTSYEYDFIFGGDMTYSISNAPSFIEKNTQSKGRFVLNVGTNIYFKETASLYFDFEKSFGENLYKDYQVNLGVRYSFGEKIQTNKAPKTSDLPLELSEKSDENQNAESTKSNSQIDKKSQK